MIQGANYKTGEVSQVSSFGKTACSSYIPKPYFRREWFFYSSRVEKRCLLIARMMKWIFAIPANLFEEFGNWNRAGFIKKAAVIRTASLAPSWNRLSPKKY